MPRHRRSRNLRASLDIAALLALIFTGCSKRPTTILQTANFAGFTNGYVGVIAPFFSTFTTNNAAAIQQWLADGTNTAIFTMTNRQNTTIKLSPIGRIICNAGPYPANDETPILNAPNFLGFLLNPGQVTNLQVAVFPHQTPWRVRFYYTRFDEPGIFEELTSRISGKPTQSRTYTADSDLISR
jgi:hypothetical protein